MTLRAAALAVLLALVAAAPAAAQAPQDVLPDLDQLVPTDLQVKRMTFGDRTAFRLGFSSATANVGVGPLTLHGRREDRTRKTMSVNQIVDQTGGATRVVRDVGLMSFVVHPDHNHWHLLGFEKYELRRAGAKTALPRRDRKTGFCLGDRFTVPQAPSLTGFSRSPLQADLCGLGRPDLLSLFTGISVGWGDRYEAHIEGQFIDITGLPDGRYELVHRVNTDSRLAELDYTNNASSVLFSLEWKADRRSTPTVRVLRSCPSSETCVR
jgi:hypothetical protein